MKTAKELEKESELCIPPRFINRIETSNTVLKNFLFDMTDNTQCYVAEHLPTSFFPQFDASEENIPEFFSWVMVNFSQSKKNIVLSMSENIYQTL